MPKYDINDPTDLDIMRAQFNMITHEEWDEYVELAESKKMGYKNVKILKSACKKTGIAKYLSPKIISWVLGLVDQIDEEEFYDEEE
ncbi:MAG: hypothetical protein P8M17_07755 [Saprospiraceae bacterium]|jgi:hypothetical protein|nr:hypothetical protein [Saprospiraceae bacterium]MDC3210346.1 hypothetical protein [Saprospiraceae bacterium]MDG1433659.1 hypothetical protein [Saprospiraceae bacterium]MDG2418873.1 hypothetical protein [Saprospiraceae bacterium]